jgi:hypothetical protein
MTMKIGQILRYTAKINNEPTVDGLPNWYFETRGPDGLGWSVVRLDSGINTSAFDSKSEARLPFLAIRSSPHRFGSSSTPWEDVHRPDQGFSRYFGDAKPGGKSADEYTGNNRMLDAFVLQSGDRSDRLNAPPILVFEAVPNAGRVKGQVMFHGLGVITKAELVVQRDEKSKQTFPNYVFDIALLDLASENEEMNWDWINARRNSTVNIEDSLKLAPASWKKWVESGPAVVSRLRRNVITRSVVSEKMQQPAKGSTEEKILETIYNYYATKKHRFEALAEFVAQEIFREQGVSYKAGWITQGGGDGGFDFVGSIDLDPFGALKSSRQVVLGQAKCEKLGSATNGLHIARLAARLRRGWVGIYVTTSYFSMPVQREILTDRYPVVLIDGARVASVVRKYLIDHGIELSSLLDELSEIYEGRIGFGDPDSVLA